MLELEIPNKLARVTKACVEGSQASIKVDSEYSEIGDALSPFLFNITLEKAARMVPSHTHVFGQQYPNLLLAYADDIDVIGSSTVITKKNLLHFENEARRMGLQINKPKTKYIHVARYPNRDRIHQNVSMNIQF